MTTGAVLLGVFFTARASEAAEVTSWRLPFSDSQPMQVAAGPGSGVSYVNFDGGTGATFLGLLDAERGRFSEMRIPFFAGTATLRVRPGDGAVFLTDVESGDLGQGDVENRAFRRWTLPGDIYIRSFVFDGASVVLFLAQDTERLLVGRLDTTTGAITTWPLPDSIATPFDDFAWRIVKAPDGTVVINMNGFVHRGQLVRLDLATGVFTSWATPGQAVFALLADPAGAVYFHEIDSDLRRVGRLIPATGQLTEWDFPDSQVEFGEEMALQSGRLLFSRVIHDGISPPFGVSALDPTAAGIESVVAPFVAAPVTPSTAVVNPVVTRHARRRSGAARPVVSTAPATTLGAFTMWDTTPSFVSVWSGSASGALYGTGDVSGPALIKFVP
jgi:streptogramin lyase